MDASDAGLRRRLGAGLVIPAHPLALDARRRLNERRQRALSRYYLAAGAGGLAVGVHTTQFAIRDPAVGLLRPVLELAAEEVARCGRQVVRIGGVCGPTPQAAAEATLLRDLGYDAGLLSLAGHSGDDDALLAHCRAVGEVLPLVGFYLQPAVGGRVLSHAFWRRFVEIPAVVAIKVAPFDRYRTLDVVRAVALSGRDDVALYTGNDDCVVADLAGVFD
ncbi:MAG: dihydrodipicolinate synthase family protein, partial [Planctomycetaceae bacterium]